MQIIDVHAHVFDRIAGINAGAPVTADRYGKVRIGNELQQWMPPPFENSVSTAQMLAAYMDWCHIDRALLMANPLYGYTNGYFLACMTEFPDRFKGIALVNFIKGREAADELAWIYDHTPLIGMKVETDSTFQCAPGAGMADREYACIWDVCEQYRQPVFVHLFTDRDVQDIVRLAGTYEKITFVICHMGGDSCFKKQGISAGNFDTLLQLMKERDNVYMDTSALPAYFYPVEYPYPEARSVIEKACSVAGAEKIMWGTDYPGMLKHAALQELVDYVRVHAHLSETDLRLVMGENADRLFFRGRHILPADASDSAADVAAK